MFLTIHVSVVIEIGIIDQGNWLHDSFDPYAYVYSVSSASFAAESPRTSHDMVFLEKFVQERS